MQMMDERIRQATPNVTPAPTVFVSSYTRGGGQKRQIRHVDTHVDTSKQAPTQNRSWRNKKQLKKLKKTTDEGIIASESSTNKTQ